MGESIRDGSLRAFLKKVGDYVKKDEPIVEVETDKINHAITAPEGGVITKILFDEGATVEIGQVVVEIDTAASAPAQPTPAPPVEAAARPPPPPPRTEKAPPAAKAPAVPSPAPPATPETPKAKAPTPVIPVVLGGTRDTQRVPMSRMRQRIAQRLKDSQNSAAMLTSFNEIDMTNLIVMRNELKDRFQEKHGIKLGFMSAFVKASVAALQEQPAVNAFIDGKDIVYNRFVDVSVAVATPNGLIVPVLRNCEAMSLADIEKAIHGFGVKAKNNELTVEEMTGGTFTISNGGVFGSLFGTPILNPPQSAILGMHAIKPRPVAVGDKVEIRPMMYVALTYDHRLVDGREAVLCLKSIKEHVEDPRLLLLGL